MTLDDLERVAALALVILSISFVLFAGTSTSAPGIEPKNSLDGQQLSSATTQAIQDAGSYTSNTTTIIRTDTETAVSETRRNVTFRVDLESDRGIRVTNETQTGEGSDRVGSRVVYTDGNTSYRRTDIQGNTTYVRQTGPPQTDQDITPVNTTRFEAGYASIINAISWEPNRTETVAGIPTFRYTATNVTNQQGLAGQSDARLSNVTGNIWLDENDVVRKVEIRYTLTANGNTRISHTALSVRNIGSTAVSRPGWVSEAEA
jgi:hypothetical protein